MFYIGDESRDKQCRDLQTRFTDRFQGFLLIWDEANKNNLEEWQKFTLKEATSGQKLRLVLVTNDFFENDKMGPFLSKFEDRFEEFVQKSTKAIRYKNERLEIDGAIQKFSILFETKLPYNLLTKRGKIMAEMELKTEELSFNRSQYVTKIMVTKGQEEVFVSFACVDPIGKHEYAVGQYVMSIPHFLRFRDLCNRIAEARVPDVSMKAAEEAKKGQ